MCDLVVVGVVVVVVNNNIHAVVQEYEHLASGAGVQTTVTCDV